MSKARQTFERRRLGLTSRRLREAAGTSQQAAAESIGAGFLPAVRRPGGERDRDQLLRVRHHPRLLQPLGYVRATIDDGDGIWWQPSNAELQERISFRLDRQEKTLGPPEPKTLRFVITEDALTGAVGSPAVFGPSTYFDQAPDTEALLRGFQRVQELALDPDESARPIRQIDRDGGHA